ncbi:MAG: DUF47 family protein [Patescibacteria group bacterium]
MWPFPAQKDFFKMLSDQTAKVEEGLSVLLLFLNGPTAENAERVEQIEKEADELRRIVIFELNKTFVTPIDREDIFALSRAVDDVMDYADSTVEEMKLFNIEPDEHIKEMVERLYNATKDIHFAVQNMRKRPGLCAEHLIRAKKAENSVERCYREALFELFETKDVIRILKTREIYRHLSNAADRVGESADIIGDILVKIT